MQYQKRLLFIILRQNTSSECVIFDITMPFLTTTTTTIIIIIVYNKRPSSKKKSTAFFFRSLSLGTLLFSLFYLATKFFVGISSQI